MSIKFKIVLEEKQYPVIDYKGTLLMFDSGASYVCKIKKYTQSNSIALYLFIRRFY